MKRLFVCILSLVYLTTSNGVNVNFHFCMGKLEDWALGKSKEKKCSKCGMEEKESFSKGCCKDESEWVNIQGDHEANNVSANFSKFQPAVALNFYNSQPFYPPSAKVLLSKEKAPSQGNNVPIYKRNRNFRI